jgi:hypothetical protein
MDSSWIVMVVKKEVGTRFGRATGVCLAYRPAIYETMILEPSASSIGSFAMRDREYPARRDS